MLVDRHPRPLERLGDRHRRRVAHDLRLDAGDRPGAEQQPWSQPALLGLREPHEHHRGRAVVDAGRVSGRHRAALPEDRLEAGQLLERGRARVLVAGERLARAGQVDRDDLPVEVALRDRRGSALLAAQGERILPLARDGVLLRDLLGRDAHRVAAERIGQQGERPVDGLARPQAPAGALAVGEKRLPAHRLVAAGNHHLRLAREDRLRAAHDRLEARGAEAVDVHRRGGRRESRAECAPARVVGIGADLADLAHDDLVDLAGVDADAGDQLANAGGAEICGLDILEGPAEAPDRGAHAADERDGVVVPHAPQSYGAGPFVTQPGRKRAPMSATGTLPGRRPGVTGCAPPPP